MQTWLICGGRDFADKEMFQDTINRLVSDRGLPKLIVHGGARGADAMGQALGDCLGIQCVAVLPDWSRGRIAGPLRNQRMLDEWKPDLVVAFPGGRGTDDMVRRAKKAGVEIVEAEKH